MPDKFDALKEFNSAYDDVFDDIRKFFRFERVRPDSPMPIDFTDDYYTRAATAMKNRIDHELKYLHSRLP